MRNPCYDSLSETAKNLEEFLYNYGLFKTIFIGWIIHPLKFLTGINLV